MCGFAGFLSISPVEPGSAQRKVKLMCDAVASRGPDGQGYWSDPSRRVTLGHRRLAILDVSELGAQPMTSKSGRWSIAFNGEIYNHFAIRKLIDDLALPHTWSGSSDTETLLAGFDAFGVEGTLNKCVGMFAFAVWDAHSEKLIMQIYRSMVSAHFYLDQI
jgi:asparagine synthase (glutamine-hydrolysing)